MKTEYLSIYPNCIITLGANRALFVDLQRAKYYLAPKDIKEVLNYLKENDTFTLFKDYGEENNDVLEQYINFLKSNDLVFGSEILCPGLDKEFKIDHTDFCIIDNAVLYRNSFEPELLLNLILQLDAMNCYYLDVSISSSISIDELYSLGEMISNTKLKGLDLYVKFDRKILETDFEYFLVQNQRIHKITFFESEEIDSLWFANNLSEVVFTRSKFRTPIGCGNVSASFFAANRPHYIESQQHNTCLNRKISIDANGDIKNCPSMAKSYGNIRDTTLAEAIEKPGFKDVWYIHKDQISVCKDCEFRHICTDCRAYVENPEDQYSKPLKCGYNPYTCEWEEWSTNPLKQKAIEYYGMQELVKKN